MIRLVRLVVLFMVLTGCAHVRPVFQQTDTVTVWEIDRDTLLIVMPDSALFNAWFECDSMNRVIMTGMESINGRKVEQVIRWRNNYLTVTANVDSEGVYFAWKEKHITETKATMQTIVEKVKEPPWWKRRDVFVFGLILLAYTIFLILKIK